MAVISKSTESLGFSTLKQEDPLQTGVGIFQKVDGDKVAIPLYSWDLTTEANEMLEEYNKPMSKTMKTLEDNKVLYKVIDVVETIKGNEIDIVSCIRRFKEKHGVLPEYFMDILRSGLKDYNAFITPYPNVYKYND